MADLQELKEKYGDERRTDIIETEAGEFKAEVLITNWKKVVVTLTEKGYIKRLPSSTYRAQRRGGRGITGMVTREDDTVRHLLVAHSHDSLLFFTDRRPRLSEYSKSMNCPTLAVLPKASTSST